MEGAGTIPVGTAARVRTSAEGRLNPQRILAIEATTRHDVIAFLTHVEGVAGEPARWLHLGMTSSDVLDTAMALQTTRALDAIVSAVDELRNALAVRARERAVTPMMRPIRHPRRAGDRRADVRALARRGHARARAARHRAPRDRGRQDRRRGRRVRQPRSGDRSARAAPARPAPETVATHIVARDRHADVLNAIAMLGTAIEQIALGVRHWQRTEVGEAEEGFAKGQKGSSAMPHKKNTILSENLTGLARLLRGYAAAGLEDVALWHERDISHSSVERVALPDATILADFMVARATRLVRGLVVHGARMQSDLDCRAACTSRRPCCSRSSAPACRDRRRTSWYNAPRSRRSPSPRRRVDRRQAGALPRAARRGPEVSARLDARALDACFDLDHHLRHAPAILDARSPRWSDHRDRRLRDHAQLAQTSTSRHEQLAGRTLQRYDGKVRDCSSIASAASA